MKYKVGDVVKVKSIAWYNENKNCHDNVLLPSFNFVRSMAKHCGERVIITRVFDSHYHIDGSNADVISYNWTDEMFEGEDEYANYKKQDLIPRVVVSGDMMEIVPKDGNKIIEVCGKFYVMRI
jgi:hypothetical protein